MNICIQGLRLAQQDYEHEPGSERLIKARKNLQDAKGLVRDCRLSCQIFIRTQS